MNCKVCGTRLGILERWRYGDFCSQDHREVFELDLAALDKKLVADPQAEAETPGSARTKPASPRPKAGTKSVSIVAEDAGAELDSAGDPASQAPSEPDPPMAGFLPQGDATPCQPGKRVAPEKKALPERLEKPGQLWRAMAKKAEKSELPPAAASPLKGRELPSIVVEAPQETIQSPGGFCMQASYAAMSPPAGFPFRVQGMPQPGLSMPPPDFWGSRYAVSAPVVPFQPSHWVDEQGWHWISDASAMSVPTVESVLAMYPMAAPWAQWPLMAPGAGMRATPPPAPMMHSPAGMPVATGGMAPPAGAGAMGPPTGSVAPAAGQVAPSSVPAPAGPRVTPPQTAACATPENAPLFGGAPGGLAGGVFGGGQVLGWGIPQQPGFGAMPPSSSGYLWRELPPPFFSALVDLSFRAKAMNAESILRVPPCQADPWPPMPQETPSLHFSLSCEIKPAEQLMLASKTMEGTIPAAREPRVPAEWPDAPAAMPSGPGLPRPRVPRRVAPAVALPLGSRLGLPRPAEPLMVMGAGVHGNRGI